MSRIDDDSFRQVSVSIRMSSIVVKYKNRYVRHVFHSEKQLSREHLTDVLEVFEDVFEMWTCLRLALFIKLALR